MGLGLLGWLAIVVAFIVVIFGSAIEVGGASGKVNSIDE